MRLELHELEAHRKKLVKKLITLVGGGIGSIIILTLIIGNIALFKTNLLFALIVFGVAYYFLLIKKPIKDIKQYKVQLRTFMAEEIIQKLGGGISYSAEKFIPRQEFIDADLVSRTPTTYGGKNYFNIDRGNYSVEFSEVVATSKSSSSSESSTIFSGLFFVFNLPKPSSGCTLVVPDIGVGMLQFITDWLQNWEMKDYTRYNVNNGRFEDKFSVFTNRPEDVPRLINPEFQQLLLHIKDTYKGKVYCSLGAPKTYLLITTPRSYFQLSVEKQATNPDQINAFQRDLAECIGLIQSFEPKINELIGDI
jgi:hypothetical protein